MLYSGLFKIKMLGYLVCVNINMCVSVPMLDTPGHQRITPVTLLSSTMWVPGIQLRLSALAASALTH